MVNRTGIGKLKLESKDSLLVAFRQNKPPAKSLFMSSQWAKYTQRWVSLAEYQYTQPCLWHKFWIAGEMFLDQIAGLTWPCKLPPGWTVDWDPSPADDEGAE